MAYGHGGARTGAGRKSKATLIALQSRAVPNELLERLDDLVARSKDGLGIADLLQLVEPELVRSILVSTDTKCKLELLKLLHSYKDGLPTQRVAVTLGAEGVLAEIWSKRQRSVAPERPALPPSPDPDEEILDATVLPDDPVILPS